MRCCRLPSAARALVADDRPPETRTGGPGGRRCFSLLLQTRGGYQPWPVIRRQYQASAPLDSASAARTVVAARRPQALLVQVTSRFLLSLRTLRVNRGLGLRTP